MSAPTVKVECSFTTNPLAAPVWVDISAYVRSISIRRGRSHELSHSQPGQCNIRLTNTDRRFDPTYASSPYYPNVVPMRQLRVTATHNAITYPLFYGYVENWKQLWPQRTIQSVGDAEVDVRATDGFKLLTLMDQAAIAPLNPSFTDYTSMVQAFFPGSTSAFYLRGGAAMTIDIRGQSSANHTWTAGTNVTLGSVYAGANPALPIYGTMRAITFSPVNSTGVGVNGVWNGVTGDFVDTGVHSVAGWLLMSSFATTGIVMSAGSSYASTQLMIEQRTGGDCVVTCGGTKTFTATAFFLNDGAWHHYAWLIAANQATPGVSFYRDGVLITLQTAAGSALMNASNLTTNFGGDTAGGAHGLNAVMSHFVWVPLQGLSALNFQQLATRCWDVFPTDLSGLHIHALLDAMTWPSTLRSIDNGKSVMQGFTPAPGSMLSTLLNIAEDSERGLFQMDAAGNAIFHDRADMESTTGSHGVSNATFGDSGGEVPYADLTLNDDEIDIWSEVDVSVTGSTTIGKTTNPTASSKYAPRTLKVGPTSLALAGIDQALISEYLLDTYDTPLERPEAISFQIASNDTVNVAVLSRDIHHDRVTVSRRPSVGAVKTLDCHLEGISYDITPWKPWNVSLQLVPDNGVTFVSDDCFGSSGWDGGATAVTSGAGSSVTQSAIATGANGVIELATGTTATGRAAVIGTTDAVQLGTIACYSRGRVWVTALSDATNTYTVRFGLGDSSSAESVDFIGFRYTHSANGGRWLGVCRSNSVESTVDLLQLVAANTFYDLSFRVNAAATSVQFYNGAVVAGAPITTNIPSGSARKLTYLPGFILKSAGTTTRSLLVDRYSHLIG